MSLQYQNEENEELIAEREARQRELRIPVAYYTYFLLACIAAVTAAQVSVGWEPSALMAGFVKPAFREGEYWRILTGAVLHGSMLHVLMNGYAFYSFGRLMEMLTNRAHVAVVFLLSAIGGGLLSFIFLPEGISVGASGGIVGLIGYLAIYTFRRRRFISPEFRRSLLLNIGFILIFGLVLYQVVDNFGHIGGLVTGAVYGLVQIPSNDYTDPRVAGMLAKVSGLAALGIYAASALYSVYLITRAM